MRPGQQKQRGRGRNGGSSNQNNQPRKGQNPLTRTYDSSGPDVKIRGTAQHIAEKYMALARDATSSGDRVMAENYLQHAEHYNRIIAAAQAMFQERFQRDDRAEQNDRDEDELEPVHQQPEAEGETPQPVAASPAPQPGAASPAPVIDENTPQPVFEDTPAEVKIEQEASGDAQDRAPRRRSNAGRPRRQPRQPRGDAAQPQTEAPVPAEG